MPNLSQAQATQAAGVTVNPTNPGANINALLGGIVDRKKWYWYDTLKITAGSTVSQTPYFFFQQALGQPDIYNANVQKTFLETNINPPGGQFSNPYDIVLTNLGFLFASDNLLYDITQIVKYGYFEFTILEKKFFKGHLWRHPPGAGIAGMTTRSTESAWNNGIPDPGAIYYFGQWSKYIPPLTSFGLTLQFFETVGVAYGGSNTATLGAQAQFFGQSGASLPTLAAAGQSGNGIWLIAFMNGLSDGPVQ